MAGPYDSKRAGRGNLRHARQPRADPRDGRRDRAGAGFRRRGRNALWKQIQADIYGCDVHTLNSSEGPAYGVALLAQVGTGGFSSVPEACDATIRSVEQTAVDPHAVAFYDRAYAVYRSIPIFAARSKRSASWWRKDENERPSRVVGA